MSWKKILKGRFASYGQYGPFNWPSIIEVNGIRYLISPDSTDDSSYTGSGEDKGYATTAHAIYEPLDKDGAFSGGSALEFTRYSDAERYAVRGHYDKEYEKAEKLFDAKF